MLKTAILPIKFLFFNISHKIQKQLLLPINYTYAVNSICNSRCKTCNIWKNSATNKDLTLSEWEKIIRNIGNIPYWVTISGGNQFLRKDFTQIIEYVVKYNKPRIINIPITGLQPEIILSEITALLRMMDGKRIKLNLNVSLDGIQKKQDTIRGIKGSFDKTIKTFQQLQKLQKQYPFLTVGTYTVLSKYNIDELNEILTYISEELKPDTYGFEIAEVREELHNSNEHFNSDTSKYIDSITALQHRTSKKKGKNYIIRIKELLKNNYYKTVKKTLQQNKEILPCYAGSASVVIGADGRVWQCSTKSLELGDARRNKYNIRKILFSKQADKVRKNIKKKHCYCTQSNAFYTNRLSSLKLK